MNFVKGLIYNNFSPHLKSSKIGTNSTVNSHIMGTEKNWYWLQKTASLLCINNIIDTKDSE